MMFLKKLCMINYFQNIDISKFVLKAKYDTDKTDLKKKISDTDK